MIRYVDGSPGGTSTYLKDGLEIGLSLWEPHVLGRGSIAASSTSLTFDGLANGLKVKSTSSPQEKNRGKVIG